MINRLSGKDLVEVMPWGKYFFGMFCNSRKRHSYLGYVGPKVLENRRILKKAVERCVYCHLITSVCGELKQASGASSLSRPDLSVNIK